MQAHGAGAGVTAAVAHAAADLVAAAAQRLAPFGADLLQCLAITGDTSDFGTELNARLDEALRSIPFVRDAAGGANLHTHSREWEPPYLRPIPQSLAVC